MPPRPTPTLSPSQLHERLADGEPLWLLYVPDQADFANGHVPGSLTLPTPDALTVLDNGQRIVVYGDSGHSSAARHLVGVLLQRELDVALLEGGLGAWAAAGYPVEGVP